MTPRGASKQVVLTPDDIPRILRVLYNVYLSIILTGFWNLGFPKEIHRQVIGHLGVWKALSQIKWSRNGSQILRVAGDCFKRPKGDMFNTNNHLNCDIWKCICNLCNLNWMFLPFLEPMRFTVSPEVMNFPRKRQDHKKVVIHLTRRRKSDDWCGLWEFLTDVSLVFQDWWVPPWLDHPCRRNWWQGLKKDEAKISVHFPFSHFR